MKNLVELAEPHLQGLEEIARLMSWDVPWPSELQQDHDLFVAHLQFLRLLVESYDIAQERIDNTVAQQS